MSNLEKKVVVRILDVLPHEGKTYQPNQLVELAGDHAAVFKKNGSVDDSKAAVDYCKSKLDVKVVVHVSLADELAAAAEKEAESEAAGAEGAAATDSAAAVAGAGAASQEGS